jgi:hypothetical protein
VSELQSVLDDLAAEAPTEQSSWADVVSRERRAHQRRLATRKRTTVLASVALAVAIALALLATPAFGLRDRIVHLFASEKEHHPPVRIQRYFQSLKMTDLQRPGEETGVIAARARVAMRVSFPGYGHLTIWTAPTRGGGYCWNAGCDLRRQLPVVTTLRLGGRTSRTTVAPGQRDGHVFFEGATILRAARTFAVQFEDGSATEPMPLVWVSKPIDAGFFIYEVPRSRWKPGRRPLTFVVQDAKGRELDGDSEGASDLPSNQTVGFAPPPSGRSRWWYLLPAGLAVLLASGVVLLTRARRVRREPPSE